MNCLVQITIVAVLGSLLAACGSSPPVRYYRLEPLEALATSDEPDALIVGLGPLRIADYLDRSQIVSRGSGAEITVNDFARWAEPLEQAIHTVIARNVDSLVDDVIIVAHPFMSPIDMDYWIVGRIDRFDADANGEVELVAQWGLIDAEKKSIGGPRRERYTAQAGTSRDMDAVAQAMNAALAQFSRDIAANLEAALK